MANQQVLFAETIAGMKKAFKRKAYESDSDSDIDAQINRGRKLKKGAKFAGKGLLVPACGPSIHTESINYAGLQRAILTKNPPLVDEEGYEVDSADDEDRIERALDAAADLNPYANIRLENILAPLTASTDLASHPTLSKPFTSQALTDLTLHSARLMRKENQSLWQVRHLFTALCGDSIWAPCARMIGPNAVELYTDDHVGRRRVLEATTLPRQGTELPITNGIVESIKSPKGLGESSASRTIVQMNGEMGKTKEAARSSDSVAEHTKGKTIEKEEQSLENSDEIRVVRDLGSRGESNKGQKDLEATSSQKEHETDNSRKAITQESRQHTIELNGEALWDSTSPDDYVHPLFLPPASSVMDRNLALPDYEAEDVRRLLALYVQKQEEVCRGAQKLHHGLLKAEQLRKNVLHWSKAEAHCGPNRDLSDGEDWYDKDEWGLTEDLKKGQDEEEEDTTTTGKKTRARRA